MIAEVGKNIVILAGGASSRMRNSVGPDSPLASDIRRKAKAMLGVGEGSRPFLDYLLFNVEKASYDSVVLVVPQNDNSIRDYYEYRGGAAQFPQLSIHYVTQKVPVGRTKPLGTADALLQALQAMPQWKGHRFTVCNGDNLYSQRALELLLHDEHDNALIAYDRATLQFSEDRIAQFAVIKTDAGGYLRDIIEKPSAEELEQARSEQGRVSVSMNIWRLNYDLILPSLQAVPLHPIRQEKELPLAIKAMILRHPSSVFAVPLSEHVIDLTSQADIPAVVEYLQREFPAFERKTV
jgi:NDP-sugar pyrophosphorylase family protein